MADDPTKKYPLPKFHFQLEGWGGTRIGFTEVTGLDFETQVIEYREGSNVAYNKLKQPGLTKYADVTLKRGTILSDYDFYSNWLKTFNFQDKANKLRVTVTIKLLGEDHKPVITWTLHNAWPTKIQSTDLKADGNEVAIETMVLVHEGLTIQTS